MVWTRIPVDTFKKLQLGAGVLAKEFEPATGTLEESDLMGATTGGNSFEATPTFSDYGEDIDNCPKNMMELKQLDTWEVKMSGSFVTMDTAAAKMLIGAADVDGSDTTKLVPRNSVKLTDFVDLWWIGDYSDFNDGSTAGHIAIHLLNALSTGGFKLQSTDKAKGTFEYEFTGHYSMDAQDVVPFELYIKAGTDEVVGP